MIKKFKDFLLENESQDFEKTLIQKVATALEDYNKFDTVTIEGNSIVYYQQYVIDDDKSYMVCNISRPTITQDYTGRFIFEFDEKAVTNYLSTLRSTSAKFGLSKPVKFSDLFVLKSSVILEITVEELDDFFHQEGDPEDYIEMNVENDLGDETEEEFISNIADRADDWFNELLGPNQIRELLDAYEKENPCDDEEDDDY
jgi:hypothetical protein